MSQISIGDYLLTRLKELGIHHIFGVPGDYNLGFLDQIIQHDGIEWIGTCNELNGAYASDGYARVKGAGALLTTFGVGELSAINGIAGAYAEFVPVVHIVGTPALSSQKSKAILHHTLGDGRFSVFSDIYKDVTAAQAILDETNAAKEIDRALTLCFQQKRPVYIAIPSDISYAKINTPSQPLDLSYPSSNQDAVSEFAERAARTLEKATSPVALIDLCAERHPMKQLILDFIEKTGIPFATMNMGKAIIDENHPQFIGSYCGNFSTPGVQKYVEQSDCIISFGSMLSDFNTGAFTMKIDANATIEIHSCYAQVKQSHYKKLYFCDTLPALTKRLNDYRYTRKINSPAYPTHTPTGLPLTHKTLWNQLAPFLEKNAIVLAEAGTSMFGALQMPMKEGTTYIAQTLWGSIGYTVGSLLGACVAAPHRQTILFVGDGSFQLTAQEISTIIRHRLTPTLFLIDNDGYTVERVIHGATMPYNDIQHWDYSALPSVFGEGAWSITVSTDTELASALIERKKYANKMAFITLKMEKMDAPQILLNIGKAIEQANKYDL